MVSVEDSTAVNFPHVRSVIHVKRAGTSKKKEWEDSYYISSRSPQQMPPEKAMQLIRGHWAGCEIRNHWRKDAILFEDKTRSRNRNIVGNLAVLRNLVLLRFIQHQETYGSLPAFVEAVAASPAFAMRLLW